jgi:hypothetical protein
MCHRLATLTLGDTNERNPFPSDYPDFLGSYGSRRLGSGKDFKLYPGGGRVWDWRETNTEHVPGIQPADVQELIDNGSKVVVLSRGIQLR